VIPSIPLGSDKARSAQARFLIAPFKTGLAPFEGIRLNTFGSFSVGRQHHEAFFALLQLHRIHPWTACRSLGTFAPVFQRLGAFAFSPHPGVPSFLDLLYVSM